MRASSSQSCLQLGQLLRHLGGEVVRLAPVRTRVVELPDVVRERWQSSHHPRHAVVGDRGPALVVDAAVAEHLEVLRLVAVILGRTVERVRHAHALDRLLGDPVDGRRLGEPGGFEHSGGDVDHVVELRANLAARGDPARPVDDRAVARSAPVRGDLLRPLIRRVHRVRPADREVVVGLRCAEVVDARGHELGRLERRGAVEEEGLVEAAVDPALGARPVVADDVVDERVLEHAKVVERVDEPSDVVVGVLEEAGVDLHLAGEDRLQLIGHVLPGGNLLVPRCQLRLRGHDSELLLPSQDLLAQRVPALVEAPLVLVRPRCRNVMRSVRRPRCEVHEERLVGHQRLLLARPLDRLVGHVLGEVVALLRCRLGLDRRRALVDRPGSTGSSLRR